MFFLRLLFTAGMTALEVKRGGVNNYACRSLQWCPNTHFTMNKPSPMAAMRMMMAPTIAAADIPVFSPEKVSNIIINATVSTLCAITYPH